MPKIYSDFLQEDCKRRTRKLKRRTRRLQTPHAGIGNAARGDYNAACGVFRRDTKKSRSILTDEAAFIIAI